MKSSRWNWAESSPFVLVPLFGFAFGLAVVPFAISSTEKAAEFYGAFTAAFVAAIAVVLGASYQAHLTRKRDEELQTLEVLASAKELFIWFEKSISELDRSAYRLEEFARRTKQGAQPQMPLNYENFRVFLMPISSEEAASKFHLLAKFPIQLALSVSSALQTLSSAYSPQNPSVFRDDTPLSAKDFDFWANTCRDAQALFRVAQSQIAYTMHKEFGADLPISTDI